MADEVFPGQNKIREILKDVDLHGALMLERHGGDMWDKLKQWLEKDTWAIDTDMVIDKMKEIEKEYLT